MAPPARNSKADFRKRCGAVTGLARNSRRTTSADCFVFPSRTETFGNVILEAMASGLPVAAVPSPGPSDLICDGFNGALGEDLGEACLRALSCSRNEARATALRYSWQTSHELFRNQLVPMIGSDPLAFLKAPRAANVPL